MTKLMRKLFIEKMHIEIPFYATLERLFERFLVVAIYPKHFMYFVAKEYHPITLKYNGVIFQAKPTS